MSLTQRVVIPSRIYFRIGDVAEILGVKPYVIRFWETEFPFVAPEKAGSGQRVYRRPQIEGLVLVKHLLHVERYSIEGAKRKLTELRKQAKLKEAMLELVVSDGAEQAEGANPAGEPVALQVGSKVNKDSIVGLADSLVDTVRELQQLIREPQVNGVKLENLEKF